MLYHRLIHKWPFDPNSDLTLLVRRCQKGDSRAWAILVDRYANLVYSVARRYRLNNEDAADVFQSTWEALHSSIDRIDQPETLAKWLSVTAGRLSLKVIRVSGRTVPLQTEDTDLEETLRSEDANAEQEAVRACEAQVMRDALTTLGGRCALLLGMLYLSEEPSYQEVSEKTGIPVGAIGPTRARCLEKLRKLLEKQGFH